MGETVSSALEAPRRLAGRMLRKLRSLARQGTWPLVNARRTRRLRNQQKLSFHIGCGERRLPDFVNVDVRYTPAVDVTLDLNAFDTFEDNADLIFSNAFFEHLYRERRLDHLRGARRALSENGVLCYIGLPYFPAIARQYIEAGPGTFGARFDLYNVYRYTHGAPEEANFQWIHQLHKSLFDKEEVETLLRESGFENFVIFQYAYPTDAHPVPVNSGFYASTRSSATGLEAECRGFLSQFPREVAMETLEFL